MTDQRRWFFVHLQKTAGTALFRRLRHGLGTEAVYPLPTEQGTPATVLSVERLQDRLGETGDQFRVVTGHFPLATVDRLGGTWETFTILRDPVERILSFLRHQAERRQRGAEPDTPLWEIYSDPTRFNLLIHNHMTRMLSLTPEEFLPGDGVLVTVPYDAARLEMAKEGLAGLDLFGLQHRLDEFCAELSDRHGLDVGTSMRSNTTDRDDVPEGLIDRIVHDNALDVELYAWACRLYDERHPTTSQGGPP